MKVVILGSSAAGINAARELRKLNKEIEINIYSQDPFTYSRCILHHFIEGKRTQKQMNFVDDFFFHDNNINFFPNHEAGDIDTKNNIIFFKNGQQTSYDYLIVATGARSNLIPIPNIDKCNYLFGLRNFDDAEKIKNILSTNAIKSAAIVGSGLVGIDALEALSHFNIKLSLIERAEFVLSKQLDSRASRTYQQLMQQNNISTYYNAEIEKFDNNCLILKSGETIEAEMIIVAAGITPNIDFLKNSLIELGPRGLIFDNYGKTSIDNIYAAGDVSGQHPIWPMAAKEGIVAANNILGNKIQIDDFFAQKATMNFFGINTLSLGDINTNSFDQQHIFDDGHIYKRILLKGDIVVAAILQNDLAYAGILRQLIKNKISISNINKPIFDISYADFFHQDNQGEYYYNE